jgi:hypothetical protein
VVCPEAVSAAVHAVTRLKFANQVCCPLLACCRGRCGRGAHHLRCCCFPLPMARCDFSRWTLRFFACARRLVGCGRAWECQREGTPRAHAHVCVCRCMCTCVRACVCALVFVRVCVLVCMCPCVCVRVRRWRSGTSTPRRPRRRRTSEPWRCDVGGKYARPPPSGRRCRWLVTCDVALFACVCPCPWCVAGYGTASMRAPKIAVSAPRKNRMLCPPPPVCGRTRSRVGCGASSP